jgi:hypothetical protein
MNFLNLSNYGETATDDYWSKKRSAEAEKEIVVLSNKATRLLEESVKSTKEIALLKAETVKLEKEISEIKKTKSVVLQSVSTTFSDPQSMDMEGHTLYQIAALETTIKPKKAGSTLVINMDVMCCADIGHIFSLVIDVNDKEIVSDTTTKTYVDAMVPVPDRWAQTSLLNSCFKQISVKNAKNKKDVTVKVYARYHKDGDATEKTANMMINEAKIKIKGLGYKIAGSSTLTVTEVV